MDGQKYYTDDAGETAESTLLLLPSLVSLANVSCSFSMYPSSYLNNCLLKKDCLK